MRISLAVGEGEKVDALGIMRAERIACALGEVNDLQVGLRAYIRATLLSRRLRGFVVTDLLWSRQQVSIVFWIVPGTFNVLAGKGLNRFFILPPTQRNHFSSLVVQIPNRDHGTEITGCGSVSG